MPGNHNYVQYSYWSLLYTQSGTTLDIIVFSHYTPPSASGLLVGWQLAYQESLEQHGSVPVAVTRTIFVGPPEAGKSTLKHLLVHNTSKATIKSTAVMDTPEVVSFSAERYVMEDASAWQLVDSDVMRKALHACIANKRYEEMGHYPQCPQHPAEVEATGTEDLQREASAEKRVGGTPLPNQLKTEWGQPHMDQPGIALLNEQYRKLLEGIRREGEHFQLKNASFMHLLDTGGQPSFQDVLPLLLDVPCTYIQVFNAALSLDEPVPITYRPNDCDRHSIPLQGEDGRNMMLRSFSSMQTMAQKCSKQLASFLQEGSPVPQLRIFVVGTHKDQLIKESRLDEATQDITSFLEGLEGNKPYYHSIEWESSSGQPFFLIDALGGEDDRASVNCLRECLSSEGSPLKLNVPVMWFILQEVTRHTPNKFFKLKDLETFCLNNKFIDGENAASQFRALLQLFSLLGFYSFFNLEGVPDNSNFVCTDSGVFLREVSKVLAVQFTKPKGGYMKHFKKTGIFVCKPELFKDLEIRQEMDPLWFLLALQHLGIAACLPSTHPPEYFIPAALPQKPASLDPPASVAPLCLTYTIKHGASSFTDMPRGVFCRLAVELIQNNWMIIDKSRSLLKFQWEEHEEFDIFLQECPGYIRLMPQAVDEVSSPSELHTVCASLISTVERCLSVSTEDVLGSQFRGELTRGFRCHCTEEIAPHLALPPKQGQSLKCSQKRGRQAYSNQQRIWFSEVSKVEVSWRC